MLPVRIDRQPFPAGIPAHAEVLAAAHDLKAVPEQGLSDDLSGFRVFFRQDAVQGLDEVDLAPEAGKSLGQFAADRAGTDDRQTPR